MKTILIGFVILGLYGSSGCQHFTAKEKEVMQRITALDGDIEKTKEFVLNPIIEKDAITSKVLITEFHETRVRIRSDCFNKIYNERIDYCNTLIHKFLTTYYLASDKTKYEMWEDFFTKSSTDKNKELVMYIADHCRSLPKEMLFSKMGASFFYGFQQFHNLSKLDQSIENEKARIAKEKAERIEMKRQLLEVNKKKEEELKLESRLKEIDSEFKSFMAQKMSNQQNQLSSLQREQITTAAVLNRIGIELESDKDKPQEFLHNIIINLEK